MIETYPVSGDLPHSVPPSVKKRPSVRPKALPFESALGNPQLSVRNTFQIKVNSSVSSSTVAWESTLAGGFTKEQLEAGVLGFPPLQGGSDF